MTWIMELHKVAYESRDVESRNHSLPRTILFSNSYI